MRRGIGNHARGGNTVTAAGWQCVELISKQQPGGGIITILVRGEVGAVQAAVQAGVAAASAVGKVRSGHVIARPHEEIEDILIRLPVR